MVAWSREQGYWDARLAEMPLAYQLRLPECAYDKGNAQEAAHYCPSDMPLPPNGVWSPGLVR